MFVAFATPAFNPARRRSPACSISGFVFVICLAGCSANDDIHTPQVASITPDHAAVGTVVTIIGNYFCGRPETGNEDPTCPISGTVNFETSPGTPTTWSDTAIMIEVPQAMTGSADVVVTAAGRTSNSVTFTIE